MRIPAVAAKEIRQLRRDRTTFAMIIGIPLLQIVLFGYAINLDVRDLRTGVADMANTSLSRQVVAAARASQLVDVVAVVHSAEELEELMRRGDITIGLFLPADLERRVQDPSRPAGQVMIDNSGPSIHAIARRLSDLPLEFRGGGAGGVQEQILRPVPNFEIRTYYNPERRTPMQIVPGLIGVILNLTMVLFTAIAIVRERERGNLELLITTPVRTSELMLGKILPYIVIGLVQVTIILGVGNWLFRIPIVGSVVDLYLAALAFIAASLALGLVISTLASTQFQAMQLTIFTYLPSILLSGFMFPFEGMPGPAQTIAEFLPLTHFIRLVRGIVLRGASLVEMHAEVYALGAFFVVFMVLSVLRFHKRLD